MLRPATLARPALRNANRQHCPRTLAAAAAARRTIFTQKQAPRFSQEFDLNKLNDKRRDYEANRTAFLTAGALAGVISFIYTAWKLKQAINLQDEKEKIAVKCDAPSIPSEAFKTEAGERRKVVLHDDDGREIVPTGNSTVQLFPRTVDVKLPNAQKPASPIEASISDNEGTEFTLVGLGTRTVTFLGIQVYVVGFYVATQDIARLQHYLVKKVNPMATTLIPSEKDTLRKSLLDAAEGEETWTAVLRDAKIRTLFRITPVRDTDFHHLRDGFVRAITARSQRDNKQYGDEAFGEAMRDFKGIFNRGSVPKTKEMLLVRDDAGTLSVLYGNDDLAEKKKLEKKKVSGRAGASRPAAAADTKEVMGTVAEERLSRLLWLNYLAGNKVAAEGARQNIIDGVMEFVERPVGTVATQVL